MRTQFKLWVVAAMAGGICAVNAPATLVVNTVFSTSQTAFASDVSSTDIVNAGSPYLLSVVFSNYTPWSGGASTGAAINDGLLGAVNNPPDVVMEIPEDGYSITFNLVLGKPWVITGITTFTAWGDWSRNRQPYEIQYQVVGNPTFFSLGTFVSGPPVMDGSETTAKRTITDTTGVIAYNVSAIRFIMGDEFEIGDAYREIDIFGYQIPEPSTVLLVLLGGGVLAWRWRVGNR